MSSRPHNIWIEDALWERLADRGTSRGKLVNEAIRTFLGEGDAPVPHPGEAPTAYVPAVEGVSVGTGTIPGSVIVTPRPAVSAEDRLNSERLRRVNDMKYGSKKK